MIYLGLSASSEKKKKKKKKRPIYSSILVRRLLCMTWGDMNYALAYFESTSVNQIKLSVNPDNSLNKMVGDK